MDNKILLGDWPLAQLKQWGISPWVYTAFEISFFTYLAAQVQFMLPGSTVPFTMQTMAIVMGGVVYGPKYGMGGAIFYLLLGLAGLPVFSDDSAGIDYMFSNKGGFLLGFIPAAGFAGWMALHDMDKSLFHAFLLFSVCQLLVLVSGWVGLSSLLVDGYPILDMRIFLPGLLIKSLLGSLIVTLLWHMVRKAMEDWE